MEAEMSDTIVIERAEYERLCEAAEELAELRAYDGALADLASGDDEAIPAEYAHRLIAGESPVRVYREFRALTQAQLSEASGVNRVQIAEIEAGRKTGSVETVKKLAAALGVTLDDLV
jgi:DNA-binding XRE family transcriptional regulator